LEASVSNRQICIKRTAGVDRFCVQSVAKLNVSTAFSKASLQNVKERKKMLTGIRFVVAFVQN
jgi:hypothetical protein